MDYGKLKTYYESLNGVTVPFVYPQYWDKDKEEWVVVDKDNRLPVDARLTGRNVEEVTILPPTALSGTNSFSSSVVDISKYKSFLAFARNTHDVEVEVVITPGKVNSMYWDGANWSKRSSISGLVTIPPSISADLYNLTDFFTEYKRDGFKEIQVRGRASDVPTRGSIEVFIWGVPN